MAIFPGEPESAGFIGAKNNAAGAITHAKLQSNRHPINKPIYRPDALPVTQPSVEARLLTANCSWQAYRL